MQSLERLPLHVSRAGLSPLLGVALSGGGVRASLFALGALTYLVDSKESERVTEISSVSGGSITNGFIAQRCDFQSVKPLEFDRHASELAKAITYGLVSKRFVIATYGFLGISVIAVIVVIHFLWPFSLAIWFDVVLVALFGILLLLRGLLLAYLFQRQLFGTSDHPTLRSIKSKVAHIFCATDLNASMPVYFTNAGRHFYSPAWGRAEPERAGQTRVADAVRASAAFPGGIPPMRLDVHDFDVSPTPLEKLQQWQQLAFGNVGKKPPSVLYLADGGIWNNLGTDWFEPSTRLRVSTAADWHPQAEQLLVVDASAPTAVKPLLTGFWFPFVAEALSLFRVWLVLYASTVDARVENLRSRASEPDAERSMRQKRPFLVRLIDPVWGGVSLGQLVWLGDPDHWSGRWSLSAALKRLRHRSPPTRRWVVRNFAWLNKWTAWVPTTLFAVPPEVAVQLLIHGWFSTAQTMAGSSGGAPSVEFPGVERFTKLLGLDAHRLPFIHATVLGPISALKESQLLRLIEKCLQDRADFTSWLAEKIGEEVGPATDAQYREDQELLRHLEEEEREADQAFPVRLSNLWAEIAGAEIKVIKREYAAAREIFDRIFSRIEMSDKFIDPLALANYGYALARTGDTRASTVVHQVEEKIRTQAPSPLPKRTALAWFTTAGIYALLGDAESAVRALRESARSSKDTRSWLGSERDSEMDRFSRIRNDPAFVAIEREILEQAE
jgi:predicted acylesterase/phospholipase RssA